MFRPKKAAQMTTPFSVLVATETKTNGILKKTYSEKNGAFFANVSSYGGTERQNNGVTVIDDTAVLITYFRPDITAENRLRRLTDGAVFEIFGTPENIENRNQYLKVKIKRVRGGA